MFCLNDSMKYYLCTQPTDMRKSFYTLSGLVSNVMNREVKDGEVFIFVNRNCTSMKILHYKYGGLVIYSKKLEAGTFKLPGYNEKFGSFTMEWSDLMMMVQGIGEDKTARRKRYKMSNK